MKILMISGKSGSGKDELGVQLKKTLLTENKSVLTIHFGDAVKFFLKEYYHWDGKKDEHGRKMLQLLGTEIMRKNYPTYWAELVAKFVNATKTNWDYVIIPDWRFVNELQTMRYFNKDIVTIRINRYEGDVPYINPSLTEAQAQHISECELDDYSFDWYVDNDGELTDLQNSAKELLKEIANATTRT